MHEQVALYNMVLASDFGSWLWEPETEALFFNVQYMEMLGYQAQQFPYHISTWEQLIHPDDRQKTIESQRMVLADPLLGDSFESRFRMLSASGEYVGILGRGFVICRNEKGAALRVSGMHIALKALEATVELEALQQDRMHFALDACGDGLWDWNAESGEVYYSPQYIAMLDYSPEDFPPHVHSWSSRVHPDDYASTVEKQYAYIATPDNGDVFECVYRFLDGKGRYRWLLGRGKVIRRDEQGRGTRIVGLHTDITTLRSTQERLTLMLHHDSLTRLHSRYFFDSMLEQLRGEDYPVSIIFADVDGLKLVNDYLGHAAGDSLLIDAAALLRVALPPHAVTGRVGGDEFAMLLRNCPAEEAQKMLESIEKSLHTQQAKFEAIPIYMALGLVTAEEEMPVHKLMALADKAMMFNKSSNRQERRVCLKAWIEKKTGQPVNGQDNRVP